MQYVRHLTARLLFPGKNSIMYGFFNGNQNPVILTSFHNVWIQIDHIPGRGLELACNWG